ncbi:MAG: hypothetical protein ABEJ55_08955 [Halanaeroarchaeum sp.]
MHLDPDDLAGIVDLFGYLQREDLQAAVRELAFRRDEQYDEGAVDDAIEDAVESFALVRFEHGDRSILVVGPTAFPVVPDGAEDLPHILDLDRREVDRSALAGPVRTRLERAANRVRDPDRASDLLDVTYDAEAWADLDLTEVRERLAVVADDGPG